MWKDNKGASAQKGVTNLGAVSRQNSDYSGRVEQNPWEPHLVPMVYSGAFAPQGAPAHQHYMQNASQASFTGSCSLPRYPSSSFPAPPQGNQHIRAPFSVAASGRSGSLGQHGPSPFSHGEFYPSFTYGDQVGVVPSYPLGIAGPQTDRRTPKTVMALNFVAMVIVILHIPAGMAYSRMLGSYLVVLWLAPLGVVLGIAAVYSPGCDCNPSPEVLTRRIRVLSLFAAGVDAFAVVFVPLAMRSEGKKIPAVAPLTGRKRIPLADEFAIIIALITFVHLVLCLLIRNQAVHLATRRQKEVPSPGPSHVSFTGQMRSFTAPQTPL
ncbi:hypothetical protein BSKO_02090 [Bryopsis sp. KO-2023]|nr:hypothetical protein BSKO_02090 [Bryopsis sp. KO-2023]